MSIINNMPSKQAVDIDGIIQSYYVYAGENISVGSFVEFIDGVASQQASGGNAYSITSGKTSQINACIIDTNKVFIMYTQSSVGYARVISISNNTITQGTKYTIPYSSSQTWTACCTITTNKVFLASEDSSDGGSAIIANISGTTITFVGNGPTFCGEYKIQPVRCTLWQPDKVLIHFTRTSNYYPMAVLATITNDVITYGTVTTLSSTYHARAINATYLGWNKQFVFYYSNRSTSSISPGWFWQMLYGSGDTLSYTSPSKINDDLTNSITETKTTCCTINPNTILWIAEHYCKLIKVNGNSISIANETYDYNGYTIDMPFCCPIDDNKAVINFNDSTNSYKPSSIVAIINGDIITFGQKLEQYYTTRTRGDKTTYGYPCCFLADKGKIALYYLSDGSSTTTYYVYFQVLYASGTTVSKTTSYEKQVKNITQSLCDGLSNTAGTGGTSTAHDETIDIYVPKAGFNLVNNGNFENSLTGWDSTYADVADDATYGNYLACVWNSTSNVSAANSIKYMTDGRTADKFYMCCNAKGYSTNTGSVRLYCCEQAIDISNNDTWGFYSKTFTASASILNIDNTKIRINQASATQTGNKLDITNIRLFNLTQMFGAGNEPNKAWCDTYLGGDIS